MREDITIKDAALCRAKAETEITNIMRKLVEETGLIPVSINLNSNIRRNIDGSMVISSMKVSIDARV